MSSSIHVSVNTFMTSVVCTPICPHSKGQGHMVVYNQHVFIYFTKSIHKAAYCCVLQMLQKPMGLNACEYENDSENENENKKQKTKK